MNIFLIYPHQLFKNIAALKGFKILIIQEPLFFTQYVFHIQKLILHRASMKFYENYLKQQGMDVEYCEDESYLQKYKNANVCIYELFDNYLDKKVKKAFKHIKELKHPYFIHPKDETLFMYQFYIHRRKELNILMHQGKPLHEKYSFDAQNRKKLPKNIPLPPTLLFENDYVAEAKSYCKRFDSVGECEDFYYPTTFSEAQVQMHAFLNDKFEHFGDFQDAMTKEVRHPFLFHSNLSSSLNIGLLNVQDLIKACINANVAYNAKEGFIRQLIGWREFMLSVYENHGTRLRNLNFFGHHKQIPQKILEAKSGIDILDDCMIKLQQSAYNHHIERLMVIGNIFMLLEIHPHCIYEFFMQHYIDAYDWVMVGNVYAMSCFCDGGEITTKPYICSSNYLLKMSDYSKKEPWCSIVDALYWRFLHKNRQKLDSNVRMKMQLALLDKMPYDKQQAHIKKANAFIKTVFENEDEG
jgi:deoxyribodipyrimidine photolyase-related protein